MRSCAHHNLIQEYVDVCNKALQLNNNRFPFKQILGAARSAEMGCVVEVVVTDTNPVEIYVFKLKASGIEFQPHGDCRDCNCQRSWNTTTSYLQNVSQAPEVFIQNPAKINWEWMYGRA